MEEILYGHITVFLEFWSRADVSSCVDIKKRLIMQASVTHAIDFFILQL